jgi:hypothetical protein
MQKSLLIALVLVTIVVTIGSFRPGANDIQLDGVINDNEWKDAKEHQLVGGGKLWISRKGRELYIALKGEKQAWAHVYLVHKDTVRVLHASAALGEAKYVEQNNLWRPVETFTWDLRDRVYNNELAGKQKGYYQQHGWVANNNNTGNGMTFEFKLDLSRVENHPALFICRPFT